MQTEKENKPTQNDVNNKVIQKLNFPFYFPL